MGNKNGNKKGKKYIFIQCKNVFILFSISIFYNNILNLALCFY